ncbi:putative mediator of RNA polymerase II transcription subunit 12 [Topomyia yanbarensis]|uniref:putative mediator of RNA polymerase II transcription subunit 12 n=1 Tax=Topomyia yanbarensis TaxID=2498891 RepID=UPI00273B68CD|nr:putative mediator of RNA polymerase II transcription subunit 12 [Topomyia yanbarensis]
MKLFLVIYVLSAFVLSIQCRPQAVQAAAEHRTASDVLKLPFYGGARGQILEIRKNSDGTVVSKILRGDDDDMELKVHQIVDELKNNEEILAEDEEIRAADQSFGDYLLNIQKAAASLVTLQEQVKKTGKLSADQKKIYADNLEKLGVAAQKLAHVQQQDDDHDAIKFLFDSQFDQSQSADAQKKKTTYKITSFPGFKGKEEEQHHKKKEEEENVGEEEGSATQHDDSVQVNSPEKEASIAEAKPVGLAIAGEGGVASSKPVATAVVGDGGLAVARPVATAIAGIKPSELGSLGLPISFNKKLVTKGKYGLVAADQDLPAGLLVGPGFQEARVSQNEIEAEIDDARQQALGQMETVAPAFDTEKFLANLRQKAKQHQQLQQQQQQLLQQQQQQQSSLNPQTIAYQPPSFLPQTYPFMNDYTSASQFPVYTPSYLPYYSWNPYMAAYQNQLAILAAYHQQQLQQQQLQQQQQQLAFQSQYNPYYFSAAAAAAPVAAHSFQQYEYPQRATFYSAPSAITPASAAAYPSYYNYPSYSTPSPYRFFYY